MNKQQLNYIDDLMETLNKKRAEIGEHISLLEDAFVDMCWKIACNLEDIRKNNCKSKIERYMWGSGLVENKKVKKTYPIEKNHIKVIRGLANIKGTTQAHVLEQLIDRGLYELEDEQEGIIKKALDISDISKEEKSLF